MSGWIFSPRSVRARLALWNVGILALVLAVLGTAFRLRLEYTGTAEVDRTLTAAAHSMWELKDRPPPHHDGHPGEPPSFDDHPMQPPHGGSHPLPRLLGEPHWPPSPGDGPFSAYQPRFLDLHGNRLFAPPDAPRERAVPWDQNSFAQSAQGQEVSATIQPGPKPLRVFSAPIRRGGTIIGVAQLVSSLAPLRQEVARLTRTLLTLIPLALLVAGLGGAFLTDRALRPVRALGQAASRIEASDLSRRLPATGGDEFAALAVTFNGMLSRLEQAFQAMEAAYEQQRRFTADASHELRTPLTVIKANTSLALLSGSSADYRRALEAADLGANRTIRLIQDLLLLARADAGQEPPAREVVSLADILAQAAESVQAAQKLTHAALHLHLPRATLCLQGDPDSLRRLFVNLLENALRHTPPDGAVTVSAQEAGSSVNVTVADTGEGIAPEHLPHLFDRFYRADAARSRAAGGTGLGLAICRSIAEAHGGTMTLESEVGVGTTVSVILPYLQKLPGPL